MTDLLVLGAGPAGLAAALVAARRGLDVVVLGGDDAEPTVAEAAGVVVDLGEGWLPTVVDDAVEALLGEAVAAELHEVALDRRVRVAGCWTPAPAVTADLLRHHRLSLTGQRLLQRGPQHVLDRTVGARPATSFADAVRQHVGTALSSVLHEPFAERVWGLPAHELSPEHAAHRPGVPGDWSHRPATARVRRVRGGLPVLGERLRELAVEAGADVRGQVAPVRVTSSAGGPVVVDDAGEAHHPGTVVATLPLLDLALLSDQPEVVVARGALRHRASVDVVLVAEGGLPDHGLHELPTGPNPVVRLRSVPATDPALSVWVAELATAVDSSVWTASPQALVEEVLHAVEAAALPRPRVLSAQVRRRPRAWDVMDRTWPTAAQAVGAWAERAGVLAVPGRRTFGQPTLDLVMAAAVGAARAVGPGGVVDRTAWSRARTVVRDGLALPQRAA